MSNKYVKYHKDWEGIYDVDEASPLPNNDDNQHASRTHKWDGLVEVTKILPTAQRSPVVLVGIFSSAAVVALAALKASLFAYFFATVPPLVLAMLMVVLKYFEDKPNPP